MSEQKLMSVADAEAWIKALDTAPKTEEVLRDKKGMCCLGVLADMRDAWDESECGRWSVGGYDHMPPDSYLRRWGLPPEAAEDLAEMNDHSETFAPVIAEIRRLLITERDATAAELGWEA